MFLRAASIPKGSGVRVSDRVCGVRLYNIPSCIQLPVGRIIMIVRPLAGKILCFGSHQFSAGVVGSRITPCTLGVVRPSLDC